MSLQFVLGRSGSGKSYHLYKKIIEQASKHPERQYLVVVPEQFTMQTQRELVEMHPRHGISNIDVLSFMRLAYRVFEEQGGMKKTVLEDTGKSMLVRRVITEKKDQLQVFQNYAKKPGYISEIKSLLSEFYQYDVKEETVDEMLKLAEHKPMLRRKLEDMKVILRGFEEQLADKYITTEEILDALMQQLEHTEVFHNSTLVLDGFTGFTPVQYKLLRKLLTMCDQVLVTVTIDPQESEALQREEFALYHLSRETIEKLRGIAQEIGVSVDKDFCLTEQVPYRYRNSKYLACLERNLYRFQAGNYENDKKNYGEQEREDIVLFAGKNMQAEVEFAVREVYRLVKEDGYRYRDIAIVTGDMEAYSRLLEGAFASEQIPCFMDYKKKILENPLVELIRTILQLFQRNFDYESVFRYLRCGFVDIDEESVDKLENYVIALGIKGKSRYKKPFKATAVMKTIPKEKREEHYQQMEEYREEFWQGVEKISTVFSKKQATVLDYTLALHEYLLDHKIFERCMEYQQMFEERGEKLLAKEYSQVYKLVLGIFDKLVAVLGDELVSLSEYSDLLENGFQEVKVGLIPPGVDQIVVGDIERTRLKDIKALFFLGVNEGIVPKSGGGGGILSDLEREMLAEQKIVLAPTARQTVFTQQFYFYLNLTKPSGCLYLTYHKTNQEGKQALPSGLLRTVQKIFPKLKVREEEKIALDEAITPAQMQEILGNSYGKRYLIDGMRQSGELALADWWKELYGHFAKQEAWKEGMDQLVEGVGYINRENTLNRQVAEAMYGKILENSVTRIEKYAACAYAHFLQYGLRLQERQEYQFRTLDFGNVFHQVLAELPGELEKQGSSWKAASEEQMSQVIAICLERATKEYGNEILNSSEQNAYLVERMERMLNRTAWALSLQLKQGQFDAVAFEQSFNGLDGLSSARMDLGQDCMIRLKGKIDRIDKLEETDRVLIKIIDYKTNTTDLDYSKLYYGLQLQLIVYRNATMEIEAHKHPDKKVETAGIFYYNIEDPVVERAETEEEVEQELLRALRMNGLVNQEPHIISMLDHDFENESGLAPSVKSWVIPVETKKDCNLTKQSKVASGEQIAMLGEYAKRKIEKEAREIMEGNISISPYQLDQNTSCAKCQFKGVCNFDPKLPGNAYRKLEKLTTDQAWVAIENSMKGEEADE